jgi:hypothetical protein
MNLEMVLRLCGAAFLLALAPAKQPARLKPQ